MRLLEQLISLAGAILVLAAYLALQRVWLTQEHRLFSILNLLGGLCLVYVAIVDRRIGFIVLEGSWVLLSLPGAVRRSRGQPSGA